MVATVTAIHHGAGIKHRISKHIGNINEKLLRQRGPEHPPANTCRLGEWCHLCNLAKRSDDA